MNVLRGILLRFLQAFAVPTSPAIWYRRYFPLVVLVIAAVGGVFFATVGTSSLVSIVDATTGGHRVISGGVRGAVVVAWLALVAFVITLGNLIVPSFRHEALILTVPETLDSWLAGMAAVGLGLLIGISVFR
jgi:hypothetical protein